MIKNWVVSLVIFSFSIFHNSQYHVAAVAPIKTAMGVPTQFRYILTNHPQGFLQLQPDVKPVTRRFRTANNPSKAIVEPHSTIQEDTENLDNSLDPSSFDSWYNITRARDQYFTSPQQLLEAIDEPFDAVVIPSGGVDEDGSPKIFVKARIDALGPYSNITRYWISSGAYSPHVAVKRSDKGSVVEEGRADALYLVKNYNVLANQVLIEAAAKDSIGNAYFSRIMCEVLRLRKVLVVTNRFHIPRIRLTFDWTFNLAPQRDYQLFYLEVPDVGLKQDVVSAREEKERLSLVQFWNTTRVGIKSMLELGQFIYTRHRAYSVDQFVGNYNIRVDEEILKKTY